MTYFSETILFIKDINSYFFSSKQSTVTTYYYMTCM